MAGRGVYLLALALLLVAVYVFIETIPPPTAGTAASSSSTPTAVETSKSPQATSATVKAPSPTPPPSTKTSTTMPTFPPQTSATPPRVSTPPPAAKPVLKVVIKTPPRVNLTKLPAFVNYTVVVENSGDDPAAAEVGGLVQVVPPHANVTLGMQTLVEKAGPHTVYVTVNKTVYNATIYVYYYTPVLVVEEVTINTTRLPADVYVSIPVKNVGNATAHVEGVEIPPGGSVILNKIIRIKAAGTYKVIVGGVEAPIRVAYLTPICAAEIDAPKEAEVAPGALVTYIIRVKNAGNATATCLIDGKPVVLKPGQVEEEKGDIKAEKAGLYAVAVEVNGTRYLKEIYIKMIKVHVQFRLLAPEKTPYSPTPYYHSLESDVPEIDVEYQWLISTNATRPAVVYIEGTPYRIERGGNITITKKAKVDRQAEFTISVNGTTYTAKVELRPREPTITQHFKKMVFKDSTEKKITLTVSGIDVTFTVKQVNGTAEYGDKIKIDATIMAMLITSGVELSLQAVANGGSGTATGVVVKSDLSAARPGTTFEIWFKYSGGRVTEITKVLINGTESPRAGEVLGKVFEKLPAILQPPPTGLKAREFARQLVSMFTEVTWTGDYEWDGYVKVGTPHGAVKVYVNPPRAEGPVEVVLE